jgi:glycosyltransferase involved in cell wall biosynthesis
MRRALRIPICCTLQGEDLFLDGLGEPYRQQSLDLIRAASVHVDAFLPVSRYYCDYMPGYLGIPRSKMRAVPLGINMDGYTPRQRPSRADRAGGPDNDVFTIGYFARVAPEKGLHVLADAYRRLRARPGLGPSRLLAAGYLAPEHQAYLDDVRTKMKDWGLAGQFEYRGELDRPGKIRFLQSLDVMSVPATYAEPKGIFLLEAMANGVPVVQPRRGAFPEIIERTGGGLIVEADDGEALADGLLTIWTDPERAAALGEAGAAGVREHYTVGRMAEEAESAYRSVMSRVS